MISADQLAAYYTWRPLLSREWPELFWSGRWRYVYYAPSWFHGGLSAIESASPKAPPLLSWLMVRVKMTTKSRVAAAQLCVFKTRLLRSFTLYPLEFLNTCVVWRRTPQVNGDYFLKWPKVVTFGLKVSFQQLWAITIPSILKLR